MLIAQITDLHVAESGAESLQFVDANAQLAAAIEFLNSMRRRPDVVVATGDLTDNGLVEEYRNLRELLDALEIPLYLIGGNHDEVGNLTEALDQHRYLPRDGEPQQYVIDEHDVRIVAVDTSRPGHHEGMLDSRRIAWLDEALRAAPGRPTLVMMHHPPFETGIWWMDCSLASGNEAFEATIRRHPQVRRVIAGHIHRAIQIAWDETIVSVSPSTAYQVALELTPEAQPFITAEPPMMTLLDWNGDRCVTHTTAFDTSVARHPVVASDLWPHTVEFLRDRPPFPKGSHAPGATDG